MKQQNVLIRKISSICLVILYFLAIGWMFKDIMSRETVVSKNTNVLVMGTNATFKPFE